MSSMSQRATIAGGGETMSLCDDGRIALRSFAYGFSVVLLVPVYFIGETFSSFITDWWFSLGLLFVAFVQCSLFIKFCPLSNRRAGFTEYPIIWRASFLGSTFGMALLSVCFGPKFLTGLGLYGMILSFFHFSEYIVTAYINPRSLNLDSFLLNHSKEYHIAMLASWFEFAVECYFYPDMKQPGLIAYTGLGLCCSGEMLRKCAMLTAGSNFHHLVRVKRDEDHKLVTTGVYSVCRHPSYAGWFLWSVGTQLLLNNPFCTIAYTMVTWVFFRERVEDEEITLLEFFGSEYADYQKRVVTGLPFIRGFKADL